MKKHPCFGFFAFAALAGILPPLPLPAMEQEEIRAVWIQAWVNDLHSPAGIDQIIATARAANINTLIPQVRRRADTLHFSDIEPRISQLANSDFDALRYIIDQAHAQNPPMEVHAWIIVYPIGGSTSPDHIRNQRPEWHTHSFDGAVDSNTHDPGHPGVQQYLLDVCMELIGKYPDVDGLHYDYIRYWGNDWGYNPEALDRFHRLHGRSDHPARTDSEWSDFRRNQITQTVRRIYLHAMAARPEIKISAATITWSPGPADVTDFASTRPYSDILSNWPAWMEEGTLDLNVPMAYFREHNEVQANDYRRWIDFIKDTRFNRQAIVGPAIYLNTIANSIVQIRAAREPTAQGPGADGVAIYAYHATNTTHPNHVFYHALVNPTEHDPVHPPVFAEPAAIPDMPWKSNPTTGHLMGHVRGANTQEPLDGAWVRLTGETKERLIQTDSHGFYGFVDLSPGDYSVRPEWRGVAALSVEVGVAVGEVRTQDLNFAEPPPTTGVLEGFVRNARTLQFIAGAAVRLSGETALEVETDAAGFYRFPALSPGNYFLDATWDPSPAPAPAAMITIKIGETTVRDLHFAVPGPGGPVGGEIILDNEDGGVTYEGSDWRLATAAPGRFGGNYRFTHTPGHPEYAGLHRAIYTPELPAAGPYRIETWYPAGGNRANDVPHAIWDGAVERVFLINQRINGGQWVTVSDGIFLDPAANPHVAISNDASPIVVMADAIRWTLLGEIEPEYSVAVDIVGEGRVEGLPQDGVAAHGTSLDLAAVGRNGFAFSHWERNAWGMDNPLSLQVGNDLRLRAVFSSAYSRWVEENLADDAPSDPAADPGNRGIPNVMRFAFGLDPLEPSRDGLPRMERDGSTVTLVFRRRTGDSGVVVTIRESADLTRWDPVSEPLSQSVEPLGQDLEEITLVLPISEPARFFRVAVELQVW